MKRFLLGVFFSCALPLFAETTGEALRLSQQTSLFSEPRSSSSSLGRLPAGTVLSARGAKRGGYINVTVELENGDVLEGWVSQRSIATAEETDEENPPAEVEPPKVRRKRVPVPKDEALLLRREPSFFYGVQGGATFGLIQSDLSSDYYSGLGLTGGAHGGFYLERNIPLRFELDFKQLKGTDDILDLSFNFLDLAVIGSYEFNPFEVFLGFQYSMALGVGDVPRGILLQTTSELSSLGMKLGGGYRFSVGYMTDMILRVHYDLSFLRSPFSFQNFSFLAFLEFRG